MSTIKIKKSKQGSLHKHLGVPQGKKIPASKLRIKSTDSPAIKKKKQFAINAKKWKHEDGGIVGNEKLFDINSYNNLSPIQMPQRSDYYPIDFGGSISPERLGLDSNNIYNTDLTKTVSNYATNNRYQYPNRYLESVGGMQNGRRFVMDKFRSDRYGNIPDVWSVSQGGKDYNYKLDSSTGKLSTPSLNQMEGMSDKFVRSNTNNKNYKAYKNRQQLYSDYMGSVPQYSWGGVLADTAAGAGMGALAGAPIGGIGALPGAIIGGAGAFLKGAVGEIAGNKEERQKENLANISRVNANFNNMMSPGVQNPFTPIFANGGIAGINAEIEKKETIMSPDGTMTKYNLPSHGQVTGDNFKSFDPGTMVFSDKLMYDKNNTFAKQQTKYMKISDEADKTLKNTGSTVLNKKTAERNKENAIKLTTDLFNKQNAMTYRKGGKIPKATEGLLADDPNNLADDPNNFYLGATSIHNLQPMYPPAAPWQQWIGFPRGKSNNNLKFPLSAMSPFGAANNKNIPVGKRNSVIPSNTNTVTPNSDRWNDLVYADSFQPLTPNIADSTAMFNKGTGYSQNPTTMSKTLSNMPSYKGPNSTGTSGINWGNAGMQALSLAPDIYNLGQALFSKPEKIERNRYFNPYTNQIRSRMNDRRFNIDPILSANRNANAVYNRNITNASGGDRSRLLSNALAGMNARQSADAAAWSQKINMDNQYANEQANMDYYLGSQNAQALMSSDDINARNLAAKRNYGASAASGIQQWAQTQQQMRNQLGSQRAYLDVLQKSNPFFNPWLGIDDLRAYGLYN